MPIKIYIDQGHNPENPNAGAEGNGVREQDISYEVGHALYDLLEADPNFEARLSRPTPDVVLGTSNSTSLAARVGDANSWGADWFISLHTNASENPSASGSEAFVYSASSPAYPLAEDILQWLRYETGLRTRGVFIRPGLYVLRKTAMPSILIEMGFISNPAEAALMSEEPERFAQGIYQGILQYFGLL
ncbi:MAG: N-acetylmuramoyl-L-alanine amidase [Clostridia bacterium]|nr:N-acetylmuramoyl-L-alanine amidase [Clostridia bacterium]